MNSVLQSIEMFPDQCEQAWRESKALSFGDTYRNIYNIVVCGMGGSRFPAKTVKELFRDRIKEPYEIVEDYTLPAYVDHDTLVILSSYSGTTEEVLACGADGQKRGARLAAISSKKMDVPGYYFAPKHNPSGQPRIGVGYMLMGHLGLLRALHMLDLGDSEVAQAVGFVKRKSNHNRAKIIAHTLEDTHPIIITSEFLKGFGNGFANQINETAKMFSDYRYIPELNHHFMEGLQYPEEAKKNLLFIFIESSLYSEEVKKRYRITKEIVEKQKIKTFTVGLTGSTKLAQVLEAYSLSGLATYYMAEAYRVDPSTIPWVDYFKIELAKG